MIQKYITDRDNEYLAKLVTKYKAYSKLTDTQKLLVGLFELNNKSDDDFKKLQALLKAERKAESHFNAQKKIKELLKAEKDKERKLLEHKKFLLGGALYKALSENMVCFDDVTYQTVFQSMVTNGLISLKDKKGNPLFEELIKKNHNQGVTPYANS